MPAPDPEATLAAIDLGSNSFHMVVARLDHGLPIVVDRIREHVQLAAALDADKNLVGEPRQRSLDCLRRFGERLAHLPPESVRAVGTNTLRKARNVRGFLQEARDALGHDIEIISGREEARLIYLGVAHAVDHDDSRSRRLVIDIGGGSTEIIVGERFEPMQRDSLQMGCVSYTRRYFPDGAVTERRLRRAIVAARLEMRSLEQRYRNLGWDVCIGASGTIKAVDAILRANDWGGRGITSEGLHQLREVLAEGRLAELVGDGLSAERAPSFAGGVSILLALFETFGPDEMIASTGALREGALHDLLGRIRREDVRDRTVGILQEKYDVDRGFAALVEGSAIALFEGIADDWGMDLQSGRRFLGWAARTHEIGLSMSHSGHHRHAAYIVGGSDLPGFSRDDQALLAALLLGHRRKVTRDRLRAHVAEGRVETALRLCICLRLARRLNRARRAGQLPRPVLRVGDSDQSLRLEFEAGWLEEHPLTCADLQDEAFVLAATGYTLEVR